MRKYIALARLAFLEAIQEKEEIIIWVLLDIIPIFVMGSLWLSNQSSVTTMSISQLITYYIMVMIIGRVTEFFFDEDMSNMVRTGEFSKFLLKPLRFPFAFIPQMMGRKLFSGIIVLTPIIGVVVLFFRQYLVVPHGIQLVLFLFSILLTLGIRYALSTLAAAGAFFWEQSEALTHARWILEMTVGGYLLPFSLFPSWIRVIPESLPLKYVYYIPVSIFTGAFDMNSAYATFGAGILWTIAMIVFAQWVWRKGVVRYSGVGG